MSSTRRWSLFALVIVGPTSRICAFLSMPTTSVKREGGGYHGGWCHLNIHVAGVFREIRPLFRHAALYMSCHRADRQPLERVVHASMTFVTTVCNVEVNT